MVRGIYPPVRIANQLEPADLRSEQKILGQAQPGVQALIADKYKTLVNDIWAGAEKQTQEGYDCNTGAAACKEAVKGKMVLVQPTEADKAALKKIFEEGSDQVGCSL